MQDEEVSEGIFGSVVFGCVLGLPAVAQTSMMDFLRMGQTTNLKALVATRLNTGVHHHYHVECIRKVLTDSGKEALELNKMRYGGLKS
jgi:hypothetical protein